MTQAATLAQLASSGALSADTSGNVGLGTTPFAWNSSAKAMDIATGSTVLDFSGQTWLVNNLYYSAGGSYIYKTTNASSFIQQTSGQVVFYRTASGTAGTTATILESARLSATGQLLVGTNSGYFSELFTVVLPTASVAPNSFFYSPNTSYTGTILYTQSETGSTTAWKILSGRATGGSERVVIYGNGNIQNANNSYGAISDIKLKENIVDATPKLDELMQVKVRNYNLKTEPEHKQIGVIAQELEQIFPSMIEEAPDRDAEDNPLESTTKSVKYSVFVPILIKALQELKAELDVCKAEIAALKGV